MSVRNSDHVIGQVNGRKVKFIASNREYEDTSVVAVVALTVPISLDDVAAALWIMVLGGLTFDELADDDVALSEIMSTVYNDGSLAIVNARCEMDELEPHSGAHWAIAQAARQRAAQLFGTTSTVPAQRGRAGAR